MEEKLTEKFKEQFKTELENAFARGVKAGGVMIAKNVLAKLNEYKRNQAVGAQKVREFCNYIITFIGIQEDKQEEQNEQVANDV